MSFELIVRSVVILSAIIVIIFAGSLLELYTQLSRYKKYWLTQNQQAVNKTGPVYVAFGDSAAQGVGATKPGRGYVGLIASQLTAKKGEEVRTINLSKSGAVVQDVLDTQLPEYEKLKLDVPAYVTVEIGANDMLNFDAQKFETQMDELMSKLPKQAVISDIPYFGGSRFKKAEVNVEQANKIMQKLATRHGYKLANLHDRVAANSGLNTFAADWFHPSDYAYKTNWAPAFLERLEN